MSIKNVYHGQVIRLADGTVGTVVGADFSTKRVFYSLPGRAPTIAPELEDSFPSAPMAEVEDISPDPPPAPRCTLHRDRLAVRTIFSAGGTTTFCLPCDIEYQR